jgi:hypothetical protein
MYVQTKPPEKPNVPLPASIQVSEPFDVRFKRLESMVQAYKKGFEFADSMLSSVSKVNDPKTVEVLMAQYNRAMADLEKQWQAIYAEVEAFKNGNFRLADEPQEKKKEVGGLVVVVLLGNAPQLQTPQLIKQFANWQEALNAK